MGLSVITTYVLRSVLMVVVAIALSATTLDLVVAVISVPIPSTFFWKNKGLKSMDVMLALLIFAPIYTRLK
jgi:hypothetical protein